MQCVITNINLQMDIVSRLKNYINFLAIPVTQFADNCSIPRPTLSQLLNGRNKKVSDELISKIHEAYPKLSVLWLMFGEGEMLHESNTQISEGKQASIFDFSANNNSDIQHDTPPIAFDETFTETEAENLKSAQQHTAIENAGIKSLSEPTSIPEIEVNTISFSPDQKKKIVNIIVYYNDNSFESFIPNPNK